MWRLLATFIRTLPVPVSRKRFLAELFVFILGISDLLGRWKRRSGMPRIKIRPDRRTRGADIAVGRPERNDVAGRFAPKGFRRRVQPQASTARSVMTPPRCARYPALTLMFAVTPNARLDPDHTAQRAHFPARHRTTPLHPNQHA